jgi:ABC-2 type transport system ATP-binding protein
MASVELEIDGLRRQYGSVIALDGLSFDVPSGQVFGFLGPNGAGKTTTMRAIFGVASLDAGEIRRLGLAGREDSKIDTLSHGNQQRAQLAVALVHDPELLVLDEPFAGLDPGGVDDMRQVLAERAAAGVTVLFSSHQLDLVEDICEAVAIIHHGRLVASGPVEELRRGDRPRLAVRVGGDADGAWAWSLAADLGEVEAVRPGGTVLISLTTGADSQRILDLARAAGPIEHFSFEDRRLSEVFREVTGASVGQAEAEHAAAGVSR